MDEEAEQVKSDPYTGRWLPHQKRNSGLSSPSRQHLGRIAFTKNALLTFLASALRLFGLQEAESLVEAMPACSC